MPAQKHFVLLQITIRIMVQSQVGTVENTEIMILLETFNTVNPNTHSSNSNITRLIEKTELILILLRVTVMINNGACAIEKSLDKVI